MNVSNELKNMLKMAELEIKKQMWNTDWLGEIYLD